jgi:desulfoferrodoxin (superoxide reductase-like protein)
VAGNGAKVPAVLEMTHPMEGDHSIAAVRVTNARDPVPSKGVFHFTTANGQVYLSYQIRLDAGPSEVSAEAECTRHGRWSAARAVSVVDGAGGCAASAAAPARSAGDVRAPAIRIPELLKRGRLRPGEIALVQLVMRHPSRTGLARRDGRFVQESEPLYLKEIDVIYGGGRVCRFELTSALADDPFIGFKLRVWHPGLLQVVATNNLGQQFEAAEPIALS